MTETYDPKSEEDFPTLTAVRDILRGNRTRLPYIVEFSGLPKSGKTTTMNRTVRGLDRLGLRCSTVTEAATTKIDRSLRSDLFVFNMLCYFENLQSLISESQRRGTIDIAIIDRGVIDSFVWFEFLNKTGLLQDELRRKIEDFAKLSTWLAHVHHVVYIKSDWRSYKARYLLDSPIKEEPTLSEQFFGVLANAYDDIFSSQLPKHIRIQTINGALTPSIDAEKISTPEILRDNWVTAYQSSIDIISSVFEGVLVNNNEYIAVLPSAEVTKEQVESLRDEEIERFVDSVFFGNDNGSSTTGKKVSFEEREIAEVNPDWVQIVVGAYIIRDNRIMVLQHAESEKRDQLRKKLTILVTGHVDQSDLYLSFGAKNPVENCLFRELKEELVNINWPLVQPKFALRIGKDEMGRRHLGLIYEVQTISSSVNVSGLAGAGDFEPDPQFWASSDLELRIQDFDDWSQQVIRWLYVDKS